MSAVKEFGAASSPISTKAELDKRIAARAKPEVTRHLTISGPEAAIIHRELDAANESRIGHLCTRLERAKENLRGGYAAAQKKGKAKSDFGRSC